MFRYELYIDCGPWVNSQEEKKQNKVKNKNKNNEFTKIDEAASKINNPAQETQDQNKLRLQIYIFQIF